jgi:hypothetical protein
MQVVITAVLTTSGQLASMKFAPGLHTAPMHAMNGSSGGASSNSSGGSGAGGGAQGDVADFYGDGGAGAGSGGTGTRMLRRNHAYWHGHDGWSETMVTGHKKEARVVQGVGSGVAGIAAVGQNQQAYYAALPVSVPASVGGGTGLLSIHAVIPPARDLNLDADMNGGGSARVEAAGAGAAAAGGGAASMPSIVADRTAEVALSRFLAVVLLCMYGMYLLFQVIPFVMGGIVQIDTNVLPYILVSSTSNYVCLLTLLFLFLFLFLFLSVPAQDPHSVI